MVELPPPSVPSSSELFEVNVLPISLWFNDPSPSSRLLPTPSVDPATSSTPSIHSEAQLCLRVTCQLSKNTDTPSTPPAASSVPATLKDTVGHLLVNHLAQLRYGQSLAKLVGQPHFTEEHGAAKFHTAPLAVTPVDAASERVVGCASLEDGRRVYAVFPIEEARYVVLITVPPSLLHLIADSSIVPWILGMGLRGYPVSLYGHSSTGSGSMPSASTLYLPFDARVKLSDASEEPANVPPRPWSVQRGLHHLLQLLLPVMRGDTRMPSSSSSTSVMGNKAQEVRRISCERASGIRYPPSFTAAVHRDLLAALQGHPGIHLASSPCGDATKRYHVLGSALWWKGEPIFANASEEDVEWVLIPAAMTAALQASVSGQQVAPHTALEVVEVSCTAIFNRGSARRLREAHLPGGAVAGLRLPSHTTSACALQSSGALVASFRHPSGWLLVLLLEPSAQALVGVDLTSIVSGAVGFVEHTLDTSVFSLRLLQSHAGTVHLRRPFSIFSASSTPLMQLVHHLQVFHYKGRSTVVPPYRRPASGSLGGAADHEVRRGIRRIAQREAGSSSFEYGMRCLFALDNTIGHEERSSNNAAGLRLPSKVADAWKVEEYKRSAVEETSKPAKDWKSVGESSSTAPNLSPSVRFIMEEQTKREVIADNKKPSAKTQKKPEMPAWGSGNEPLYTAADAVVCMTALPTTAAEASKKKEAKATSRPAIEEDPWAFEAHPMWPQIRPWIRLSGQLGHRRAGRVVPGRSGGEVGPTPSIFTLIRNQGEKREKEKGSSSSHATHCRELIFHSIARPNNAGVLFVVLYLKPDWAQEQCLSQIPSIGSSSASRHPRESVLNTREFTALSQWLLSKVI